MPEIARTCNTFASKPSFYGVYACKTRHSICCLSLALLMICTLTGAIYGTPIESRLDQIYKLWSQNKYAETLRILNSLSPSKHIEDLRLYLTAESLRNTGNDAQSLEIYERLIRSYPDSESAFRAGLQHFLLKTRIASLQNDLKSLKSYAMSLGTPYQRGRAFEELIKSAQTRSDKGAMAVESLKQYRSGSSFYQEMPESGQLLKTVFASVPEWDFGVSEWITFMLAANRENLGELVSKSHNALRPKLGKSADAILTIIEADRLRRGKKSDKALSSIERVISSKSTEPALLALAHAERGELFFNDKRYGLALRDFQKALELSRNHLDMTAALHRMMRSSFYAGFDRESLEYAETLCREPNPIAALPLNLYDMAMECFDSGAMKRAMPYFMLVAKYFPGHHRADAALGYAAIASGSGTSDSKNLIALLKTKYPHSFFLFWLDPESKKSPLKKTGVKPAVPKAIKERQTAWKIIWKSPFVSFAREEARRMSEQAPDDFGIYKASIEAAEEAEDYHQVVGIASRMLKRILDRGGSAGEMPDWAWKAHYPRPHWKKISSETKKYGIDPYWVLSIMREESHFKPDTLSRSNAMGLMQILPSTGKWIAQKLGVKGKFNKEALWNIDRNITFGVWYLDYLYKLFNGDLYLATAAYNGGQGNIQRKVEQGPHAKQAVLERLDKVPLPETRDYYKKVMRSYWNYKRLY